MRRTAVCCGFWRENREHRLQGFCLKNLKQEEGLELETLDRR